MKELLPRVGRYGSERMCVFFGIVATRVKVRSHISDKRYRLHNLVLDCLGSSFFDITIIVLSRAMTCPFAYLTTTTSVLIRVIKKSAGRAFYLGERFRVWWPRLTKIWVTAASRR